MTNYTTNNNNNKGSGNQYGHRPDSPPSVTPPERESELAALAEKIRAFFDPPLELAFADGMAERRIVEHQTRRREACLALAGHLEQPDGRLKLTGIIKLGEIAQALKLSYKHARQALRDLLDIGGFERQKALLFGNGCHKLTRDAGDPELRLFGNNCGHNPEAPRYFTPPKDHKQHPLIILRTIEKIQTYYLNPTLLPALNAVNGSKRRQRSERREACVALLSCLLYYTDLVTLRVGLPQPDGSMKGLTVPYLAERSGLDERRAERAIKDLKAAGIITVHALCEKLEEALYKGLAAIRVVSKHLFDALGLGDWLRNERRKATERKAKKDAKRNAKAAANVSMAMNPQRGRKTAGTSETDDEPATTGRRSGMASVSDYLAQIRGKLNGKDPPD